MNVRLDWSALSQWPRARQLLLLLGCCVCSGVLGYGLHVRGLAAGWEHAAQQRQAIQAQWLDKRSQAELVGAFRAQVDELAAERRGAARALLDEAGLPAFLAEISRLGRGLAFEQTRVLAANDRRFPTQVPIQLSVVGRYAALTAFVAALARMNTLLTFHDLTLAPLEDGAPGLLRLQLQVNSYRSPLARSVLPTAQAQPVAARDPFQPVQDASTLPLLQRVPLDQLMGVGSLAGAEERIALVRVADSVLPVREGDVLGKEGARVARVAEQHIELVEPSRTIRWGQP